MLNFSKKTDYAMVFLADLSSADGLLSVSGAAKRHGISPKFLARIARDLKRAGIVASREGKIGGYRLAADLKKVSVAEVVAALEGGVALAACSPKKAAACPMAAQCRVRTGVGRLESVIVRELERHSVMSVIAGRK